jgi:hypothetical protein
MKSTSFFKMRKHSLFQTYYKLNSSLNITILFYANCFQDDREQLNCETNVLLPLSLVDQTECHGLINTQH